MRELFFALLFLMTLAQSALAREFKKGEMLFRAAGCANCHASSGEGEPDLGGGTPIVSNFGTFYAPNISRNLANGIGGWTDDDFIAALREGVSPQGEHYFPAFPYPSYSKMTDDDILAIKNYIFSLPSSPQKNLEHVKGFLTKRPLMFAWKARYFQNPSGNPKEDIKVARGPITEDKAESTSWNRGAYLVEAVAHCTECHTPRDSLGGLIPSMWMAGAPVGLSGKIAPNITPDIRSGTGKWTKSDWEVFLRSARTPKGISVPGEMQQIIKGLDLLSASDISAMAEYLVSLKAVSTKSQEKSTEKLEAMSLPKVLGQSNGESIKTEIAEKLFTENVHPFLRQNCAECHSETSVYPAGPMHSHTNSKLAFKVFQRFLDWGNLNDSRLIKMANSQHFCTTYHYKCDQKDAISNGLVHIMENYVTDVRKGSLTAVPPKANSELTTVAKEVPPAEAAAAGSLTGNYEFITSQGLISLSDQSTIDFDLTPGFKGSPKREAHITARLKKLSGDYHQLTSLIMEATDGSYVINGIQILINGQPLGAQTGLERLERSFYFDKRLDSMAQSLTTMRPILHIRPNDRISLGISVLKDLNEFPAFLCKDSQLWDQVKVDLVLKTRFARSQETLMNKAELCYLIESKVDLRNPRRSVILEEVTDFWENDEANSRGSSLLWYINDWISNYKQRHPSHGVP